VKGAKGKGWKSRYRGASGISARYRKKMRSTLTQFVLYPKAIAEEMRIEGKVVIGFTINREGRLEDTEVLESSGHPALDQAVEKMIEFAQPFSSLPKTVKNDKVRFAFPVTIKLKK
jgi:protein TonB